MQDELTKIRTIEIQTGFKVSTMKDERVCETCKQHEGKYFDDVFLAEIGVNHPPFHETCRCFAAYAVVKIRSPKEKQALIKKLSSSKRR